MRRKEMRRNEKEKIGKGRGEGGKEEKNKKGGGEEIASGRRMET